MTRFPFLWRRGVIAVCLPCVLFVAACGRPPQIGDDEAVFGEVDALYTAVTAKRSDLLNASRQRLEELHRSGKVPDAAYQRLSTICDEAQRQQWRPAAEKLWHFMRGQRKST
jgi:hypothetical protein